MSDICVYINPFLWRCCLIGYRANKVRWKNCWNKPTSWLRVRGRGLKFTPPWPNLWVRHGKISILSWNNVESSSNITSRFTGNLNPDWLSRRFGSVAIFSNWRFFSPFFKPVVGHAQVVVESIEERAFSTANCVSRYIRISAGFLWLAPGAGQKSREEPSSRFSRFALRFARPSF